MQCGFFSRVFHVTVCGLFLWQVTVNNTTWYVAHRYTEFSVLKTFLMQQNPYITEFKDVDEKFPGKAVGLSYRRGVLERRIEGLGAFLVFFLRNARFCRQTSVDAICSFLVVSICVTFRVLRALPLAVVVYFFLFNVYFIFGVYAFVKH